MFDPIMSISTIVLILAGIYFLLKKRQDLASLHLLLASLFVIGYALMTYPFSLLSWTLSTEPGTFSPISNLDRYLIHRGAAIRFSAIAIGLIAATVFKVRQKSSWKFISLTASTSTA